jgi:hypothetical protein
MAKMATTATEADFNPNGKLNVVFTGSPQNATFHGTYGLAAEVAA